jgi:hypothetical protein
MPQGKKIYKTANGKHIDLDLLIARNELTPAVGNARVNARGDELGRGGKIVRKKEEVLKDYYNTMSGVPDETIKRKPKITPDNVVTESATSPTAKEAAEWEEDDSGNFVKKTARRGKNESNNESD